MTEELERDFRRHMEEDNIAQRELAVCLKGIQDSIKHMDHRLDEMSSEIKNLKEKVILGNGKDSIDKRLSLVEDRLTRDLSWTLEVEVADLDGNLLSFTHVYTIEEG